ncbi:hypothetical protein [Chitinophaga rhizophila]|uniref:Uncharacterized protein n=1 Tax=Chitinophaga rhizophila TaxID=2866212 RepID=A0ABS7GI40_9BACT|nr:hypothetical protein [Chitinophaga rhizophila]MBW8687367.1 hypothetical protein [Chitinophaga rhizophila]
MAIVKDNFILQLVRGSIGKQITIYERNGQVIMAKKRGPSNKKPTLKQLQARQRMAAAVVKAQQMLADPELKAYYASLAGPGQNAYNMAVKDAYHAPEIEAVEIVDEGVTITVRNEFRVAEVKVNVIDAAGGIVKQGVAIMRRNGVEWHYTAGSLPAGGRIVAVARDLPGNEGVRELAIPEIKQQK